MHHQRPLLGVSCYSFTNEWQQRLYNLEQILEKVAKLGLGPGIEIVGFQSFREYPDISDKYAAYFRGLLDQLGLVPACLGANVDIARQQGHIMTVDEIITYIERQIISARKLGFPVIRIQALAGVAALEKIASIAERAEVHVACELHSPINTKSPEYIELREFFDRLGSPFLGFVPDFSCTMTGIPPAYFANLRRVGASDALIDTIQDIWITDKPAAEKFAALAEVKARYAVPAHLTGLLNRSMTMFAHMPVEDWREVLPYSRHIHGKFYEVDASGFEPSIPYPELMALLKKEGYHGTISAEWEGQAFSEETIGFEQVTAWHSMCSRLLAA